MFSLFHRLLSGAECLFKIVYGAIPSAYFDTQTPIPASEIAVHILDHLFEELNKVCLIQDGEVTKIIDVNMLFLFFFLYI